MLTLQKKKRNCNLAKERALNTPVIMWRFCAYRTKKDCGSGNHYFMKDFLSHTQMKTFSAKHSAKEKPRHNDYCSMYFRIETHII